MGAGASKGLETALKAADDSEINEQIGKLGAEERKKLYDALKAADEDWKSFFGDALVKECADLDVKMVKVLEKDDDGKLTGKDSMQPLNRSNKEFGDMSLKVARALLAKSPSLEELEKKYVELATKFNKGTKPPFCCVEGLAYAINGKKFGEIKEAGHVVICVPFYCEFERGAKATEENENGEESPIQKLTEALFLLECGKNMSIDIVFINDSIAEKKDEKDGGSAKLFKASLSEYCKANGIALAGGDGSDWTSATALDGKLGIIFTSVGEAATKETKFETVEEKTKRLENRNPETKKLQERKGGAVLTGLELPLNDKFKDKPTRAIRCLVDGDSAHPVGSFIGDAAYAVLEKGNTAYLANIKHEHTCISIVGADSGGGDEATQARVQNRKLLLSGFIVPFLFAELTLKYNYQGTTQLPVKAIRGDVDFAERKLPTVQPNVDLGIISLILTAVNKSGGTIGSGPVTMKDNVASSTMTTSDLKAEWEKTYGPIFTSTVELCRKSKGEEELAKLSDWLPKWIEGMQLKHYETLFGDKTSDEIKALFTTMKKFKPASEADRPKILAELKTCFEKAGLL